MTNAMVRLGALAEMHSFFRVLYAKWFYLHSVGFKNNGEKVTCALDELRRCRRNCRCTKSRSSGSSS